ncbi:MAG: nucleotidyltransferase domain-containing protein [Nanoarchaeota archaeon]
MNKILTNSQIKIIEGILSNPGINLRSLIEKTKLSPNYVSSYVKGLVKRVIVKEEILEKKRVYLRRFFINRKSRLAKSMVMLVKEEKKELFYDQHPKLRPIFEQLSELKGIEFILVYGSYARFAAEKESDIDVLIVGKIENKTRIREILVSLDMEPSIKVESLKDFNVKRKDPIHQQMLKEHILITDSGKFIDLVIKKE